MTNQTLPRWFCVLFVTVMLALCGTVAFQVFHQAALRQQLVQLTDELTISQQRLRKQQLEYEQSVAELPLVEQELAIVAPQAEAIYAREQELRAQRKALRAEAAALKAELDALSGQSADHLPPEMQSATDLLLESLTDLDALMQLLGQPDTVPDAP